jgi:hypothetical protein
LASDYLILEIGGLIEKDLTRSSAEEIVKNLTKSLMDPGFESELKVDCEKMKDYDLVETVLNEIDQNITAKTKYLHALEILRNQENIRKETLWINADLQFEAAKVFCSENVPWQGSGVLIVCVVSDPK